MTDNNNPQFPSEDPRSGFDQENSPFSSSDSPANSSFNQGSAQEGSFQGGQSYSLNGELPNNSFGESWQQPASPQGFNQWDGGAQGPKKSKAGLVFGILVGVIALLGIIFAIVIGLGLNSVSEGDSARPSSVSASKSAANTGDGENKDAAGSKVEYIVTADLPVKIRFSDNLGSHQEKFAGGEKPWTKSYNVEEEYSYLEVSVTPEKDDFENTHILTCEIKVDGKTVKKSDGEYSVSCSDSYQASKTK